MNNFILSTTLKYKKTRKCLYHTLRVFLFRWGRKYSYFICSIKIKININYKKRVTIK